jgi:predicted MPP superfamily phosphohydrolase
MFARLLLYGLRLLALASALGVWAIAIEPSRLVVREDTLAGWEGPPLRVALISDLHVGAPWIDLDYVQDLVAATNAARPDLVLLLGDYDINHIPGGVKVDPKTWAPVLGQLDAPLGVHAVLGNHDWWNDVRGIRRAMEQAGIDVHENEAVALPWEGERVWLVGIGDDFTDHDRVAKAFAGVPAGADVLAMTHTPDVVHELDDLAQVLVAGHTHGGQVRLPWLSDRLLDLAWTRGAYAVENTAMYVTSGVGTSVLPVRFGVPPEVVILTLGGGT